MSDTPPPAATGYAEVAAAVREAVGTSLAAKIAALEALVESLTEDEPWRQAELVDVMGPDGLITASVRVHRAVGRLQAQRWGWLCVVDADGRWALSGARTFRAWVATTHGVSHSTAKDDVAMGAALRDHLPLTAAAARAGRLGLDHAKALVRHAPTTQARRDALRSPAPPVSEVSDAPVVPPEATEAATSGDAHHGGAAGPVTGEEVLVALAAEHRPEPFRRVVQHFATVADPDAADRAFVDAAEREHVGLAATTGGYHLAGFLTEEHGAVLSAALDAATGAPPAGDTRSAGQRRAEGLANLARTMLDHGLVGTGAAVRPHINVTVTHTELERVIARSAGRLDVQGPPGARRRPAGRRRAATVGGDAPEPTTGEAPGDPPLRAPSWLEVLTSEPARWTETGERVSDDLLTRILCDGSLSRVIFGPGSVILDVGRKQRTVTGQRRHAVIARDRHCRFPGCDAPPSRCEVHHALRQWAADHGETSTENSVLLCWFHHAYVHAHAVRITWAAGSGWQFWDRHDRLVDPMGWRLVRRTGPTTAASGREPEDARTESRAEAVAGTHGEPRAGTRAEPRAETVAETRAKSRAEPTAETRAGPRAETVAETRAESRAGTSAETPAELPTEVAPGSSAQPAGGPGRPGRSSAEAGSADGPTAHPDVEGRADRSRPAAAAKSRAGRVTERCETARSEAAGRAAGREADGEESARDAGGGGAPVGDRTATTSERLRQIAGAGPGSGEPWSSPVERAFAELLAAA